MSRWRRHAVAASLRLGGALLLGCSTTPHATSGTAGHAGDAAADSGMAGQVGSDAAAAGSTAGSAGTDASSADSGMSKDACAINNGGCGDSAHWTCKNNPGAAPTCTSRCSGSSACTVDYPCEYLAPGDTCRGQFADWPPAYSASAFKVNGDGTVTDSRSGRVWQQAVDPEPHFLMTATKLCADLSLAGTGWRVPTKAELESLVDRGRYDPAIDPIAFPNTPSESFWTSSPRVRFPGYAWHVNFTGGSSDTDSTVAELRVRCVR